VRRFILIAAVALLAAAPFGCSDGEGAALVPDGGSDAGADADTDADAGLPWLTPDDIGFAEIDPPLAGERIYYGNWGSSGVDSLEMISPDGLARGTRFEVARLWSFGVAHDGETIAFSSADPDQEGNWGVTIGDAIQYSWLFWPGEAPVQITSGNINDECHLFSADDAALFLCRRANFWQDTDGGSFEFGNDPYRILTHVLGGAAEDWLTPLVEGVSDIGPVPLPSGDILFWRQEPSGGSFAQELMRMHGDGSGVELVRDGATGPAVSPEGDLVAFRQGWSTLVVAPANDLAGGAEILSSDAGTISGIAFSPDGARLAYLLGRGDASCSDLWISDIDGANAARLVDCAAEGLFPSGVAWSPAG
jgi:hypothetical protein